MKTRLLNDPDKLAMYQDTITNDLTKKHIRKLPSEEIPSTGWILPEHGVTNPNKPGKLRGKIPSMQTLKACTCKFPSDPKTENFSDSSGEQQPDFYKYTRFIFGAKCSPTCANFALQACGDDNKNDYPHIKELIDSNFYMDDFYESTITVKKSLQLSADMRKVLATGRFNLTRWITTNPEILSAIPQQNRATIESPKNDETYIGN